MIINVFITIIVNGLQIFIAFKSSKNLTLFCIPIKKVFFFQIVWTFPKWELV